MYIDATVSLSPSGELFICPEKPLTMSCEVSGHLILPSPRIEWMVSFEGSLSESGVFQTYVPSDPVGEVQTVIGMDSPLHLTLPLTVL